jgi:curli biogenesis system outer membrane secretion channel CsgG
VRTHGGAAATAGLAAPGLAAPGQTASQSTATQLAAPQLAATQLAASARACRVVVAVTSRASDRYTAVLTVVNTGASAVHGWTLRWRTPPGEQLTNGWNATVTSDGRGARASDAGLNRDLPPGGSTTIGFVAMPGSAVPPTDFALNGVSCR